MAKLQVRGSPDEELLLRLIGVPPLNPDEDAALILGKGEPRPEEQSLYAVLPDPAAPLAESERLAEMLGRAVGLGKVLPRGSDR